MIYHIKFIFIRSISKIKFNVLKILFKFYYIIVLFLKRSFKLFTFINL